MIRHVVMFTALEPENADRVLKGLRLLEQNPHSLHLEVGRNMKSDEIEGPRPDFVVYGEFADEAQLQAFRAHPIWKQATETVRPLRQLRVAADFVARDTREDGA